ncbi:MAG TPA: GAF domain-containing protein [Gaiellaceae bacterium]|nr:GAF domain-containing protein [Gaiellaceae bacterium]
MTLDEQHRERLERIGDEQASLHRIATLVAAGATEADIANAVSFEIGGLFRAQSASVVRWDGDTIRIIGNWRTNSDEAARRGTVLSYGGDTLTARVVETAAPARVESADDLQTEFARQRWAELGWQASIGSPIMVDRKVWGVVSASRTEPGDAFPVGAEEHLRDFSALVAQAIVNAEVRSETAALIAEQSALRQIATLVAAGRPPLAIFDAVTAAVGALFEATTVLVLQWEGVKDELVVAAAWNGTDAGVVPRRSLYHPNADGPTLAVLETGIAGHGPEVSSEKGAVAAIAAPVIAAKTLFGALTATRAVMDAFPAGSEIRLRSFADLIAQAIANESTQTELRASRARMVKTTDDARRRLERNLHDGAQQRLVSVSLALRLLEPLLASDPSAALDVLHRTSHELAEALRELRELARGLHPASLTDHGLGPTLEAISDRAPFPVNIADVPENRLPSSVEVAIYYVVSESLANAAKHAGASSASVAMSCDSDSVTVEIADDGRGGATLEAGSGLRGLAYRVEALGGELTVSSPHDAGTLIRAELPLREASDIAPFFPPKPSAHASMMSTKVSWEPVVVLVSSEGTAGEELISILGEEYGAAGESEGDWWKVTIRPIDQFRRGSIIYRVIQASHTLAARHPEATTYLVTEDGNRWKLPPPALPFD